MPFFVGMLYFIFQMPLMDTFFSKYFSFLPLYFTDGNLVLWNAVQSICIRFVFLRGT